MPAHVLASATVVVALLVLMLAVAQVVVAGARYRGWYGFAITVPPLVMATAGPTFLRGAPVRKERALNWASVDPTALLPTA